MIFGVDEAVELRLPEKRTFIGGIFIIELDLKIIFKERACFCLSEKMYVP